MWIYSLVIGIVINIVNIPFDRGANREGSKYAYLELQHHINFLNVDDVYYIDCENLKVPRMLETGFRLCRHVLNKNKFPLLIGGDHTTAVSSVFAANEYCHNKKLNLGVLWFDAHADFNTIETSPTGNIHGIPVAILCGHTLQELDFSYLLNTNQFAYYGLRDIDTLEFDRFQDYNMKILNSNKDFIDWIEKFDKIHISFDVDCLDPSIMSCVNTKVNNGLFLEDVKEKLSLVKESNKLLSMDLVEYNPLLGNNGDVIGKILKSILE